MEILKGSLYISHTDVMLICGVTYSTAHIKIKKVKDSLKKKEITVLEYCNCHDLNHEQVISFLNKNRI